MKRKITTVNELVHELCRREAKKRQVSIAQMREIVGHMADLIWESGHAVTCFDTGKVDCYAEGAATVLARLAERRKGIKR